ncbi:unnamed protein product [Rotaria sordida]|uniref:F-box domain-containing protein n=1 Tax=Rotaria sordida TaxID=392033 RepID=A0A815WGF1_9BILA|nr:unnamed protein product [Rotaria sordida]CAF1484545.1 unnamed protein product [Rotaria sordida]CAF1542907.1 unnamed protein product [Rotaria sordida]CAF4094091.1 unnamed protein product [Rotaria sordida]CAF4135493.1 unnamed protein product [Rotaria sordida]
MMNFETLPNEIILNVFNYLRGSDLFRAFYGLNSHLNDLLYDPSLFYHFNFRSISKHEFDIIFQQHFPFIADRIITIYLSNNSNTPQEINLFLSYINSFQQLRQLRSLYLGYIDSQMILVNIINQCQYLNNLIDLDFDYRRSTGDNECSADLKLIVNTIWNLPKLRHCAFTYSYGEYWDFRMPRIISSSLESFSTCISEFSLKDMFQLFDYTPRLRYLSLSIRFIDEDFVPSPIFSLINLTLTFDSVSDDWLMILFKNLPNLRRLNVKFLSANHTSLFIYGNHWEDLIRNSLPKLKEFDLNIAVKFYHLENVEHEFNQLVDSFRSSFWLDEHRWFIRCYPYTNLIHLHTLPSRHYYSFNGPVKLFNSTNPQDTIQKFYNDVGSNMNEEVFDQLIPSDIHLNYIYDLTIKFPINNQFWSIVPKLDQLESLTILNYNDLFHSQLQALLNRIPSYLCSLVIEQEESLPLPISLFKSINLKTSELNLYISSIWSNPENIAFDEQQCIALCSSSLIIECEILSISVKNREYIIYLIKNINKLRSLKVQCQDDKYMTEVESPESDEKIILTDDELVPWLKDHLPLTYSIIRISKYSSTIIIWI